MADVANGLSPPAAEQPRSGTQAAENKMSFETLMRAIKVAITGIMKSFQQSHTPHNVSMKYNYQGGL